ncbi:MAG: N-acetylmuramoyl-L-alanine amidase [bacterium]
MIFRKIFYVLLLVIICSPLHAQERVTMVMEGENKAFPISSFVSNDLLYISAKNVAIAFNANYYFNKESEKLDVKFTNFNLKVTANNHFLIITDRRDDTKKVYQLPQSAKIINDDIFIPIPYTIEYLEYASGRNIEFDSETGRFVVSKTGGYDTSVKQDVIDQKEKETVKAESYDISSIQVEEKSNGTLVRIVSKGKATKFNAKYDNDVITVRLGGVSVDPQIADKFEAMGIIKGMGVKKSGNEYLIEIKLNSGYTAHDSFKDTESNDLFIAIHNKKLIDTKINSTNKEKWNFDVIVLDAGHGGKDAGAIGITKVKEKDINLGIALKLGKLIEQNLPSVKVVYTRKKDNFVELYKRGKIANENNGKLFISIHCNSTPKKSGDARGFEVYLLRPGRTQEAINIAEFENSVIQYEDNPNRYQKLTDENFILVSMAQSAYMRYSERFSDILNNTWKNELAIPSRGIKQAGFYVLVGASMPNVLIEAGFLSNSKDEAYLKTEKGQNEIANAVFNAVKEYQDYYEQSVKEEAN